MPLSKKLLSLVGLIACSSLVVAQIPLTLQQSSEQSDLSRLLSGQDIPLTIKISDLGPDYKAVLLSRQGNELLEHYFAAMSRSGEGASSNDNSPGDQQLMMLFGTGAVFTKGDVIDLGGMKYYVTYMAGAPHSDDAARKLLRLKLVRVDTVTEIVPFSSLTPATAALPVDQSAESLSRIKQVGLATLMYGNDYDDQYPYVQDTPTAANVLMPYIKNKTMFDSPVPGGKFLFNINVGGVLMSTLPSPSTTPIWKEVLLDPNADFVVGYADGHAKRLHPSDRTALEAAWRQKYPRTAKGKPLPPVHIS